ncbi:MAG: glycosyltransferase family 2 protein [Acidimicrobiales bacterium]
MAQRVAIRPDRTAAPTAPVVSVVLPCLDEAGCVAEVVGEAFQAIADAGLTGEVVVADNGSQDGSPELAAAAGARVVHQPVRGYGAALAAGFAAARGEVVVMADADRTYPLHRIGELVAPVRDGQADLVLGARWTGATARTMPFLHRFVGTPALTFLVRRAGGPERLTDSQSGFRAFRRTGLGELDLRSTGMEFASEMLIAAGRSGWAVREIPTGYRSRIGESKLDTFRDGWRHLKTILLLAPDLVLVLPGLLVAALGLLLSLWHLVSPAGVGFGSLVWQPRFFAPILIVLGVQAALAGFLLGAFGPVRPGRRRPGGADDDRALRRVRRSGLVSLALGLGLDLGLLLVTVFDGSPRRAEAFAGLAQAAIIAGASVVAGCGVVRLVVHGRRRFHRAGTERPSRRAPRSSPAR